MPNDPDVIRLSKGSGSTRQTPKAKCELCGDVAELRPFGPRGENICFKCGMKNEKTTGRQFMRVVFREGVQ